MDTYGRVVGMIGHRQIGLGLMCALAAACAEGQRGRESPSDDRRQRLDVPGQVQDAIRLEMRTMLGSLNDLLTAGARGDTAGMRAAAARSGLATAVDPTLEKLLPEEFLHLGMSTHRQFDELGAAVQKGLPADSLLAGLGRITSNCVACHATYRLGVGQ